MRPVRFILLFAALAAWFSAEAQIRLKTYTSATDTFYWKRYIRIPEPRKVRPGSLAVSGKGKTTDRFMAANLEQFPQYTTDSLPKYTPATLKKCLHPVDINGDALADILFSGYGGDGADMVRIYLNHKDSFELVFEDYQYISEFRKADGKLAGLKTGDIGSGGDYLYFTREYRVTWENDRPAFVKVKQEVAYMHTEEPGHFYTAPVPFEAKTDTMMLRASASQLNEPFIPVLGTFGNIVAKYRSKARGHVLAVKSYGKGNDWYYVEVFPDVLPSASILYGLDRMPVFVRGWVSGQAILRGIK